MVWGDRTASDESAGLYVLVPGVNIRDLPIGPPEAFVLSCIDGSSSAADISIATNFNGEEVERILGLLLKLGAVAYAEPLSERRALPDAAPARESCSRELLTVSVEATENVDLSLEQQRRLLELDRGLPALTHYQLLGVDVDADAKQVRTAYHELARVLHPDRYFGKRLGSFENKLLRVFGKLTEAYEVLHRPEMRAAYDRELALRPPLFEEFEARSFDSEEQVRQMQDALRHLGHGGSVEARAPSRAPHAPSQLSPRDPRVESTVPASGEHRRPSSAFPADAEARRRALARKLSSSIPAARVSSSSVSSSSVSSSSVPSAVSSAIPAARRSSPLPAARKSSSPSLTPRAVERAEPLKQRYEELALRAREEQRDHYVALARESAARNDLISAANTLRVACSLDPDHVGLATELAELDRRAATELSSSYAERARFAAIEGRPAEAADCFERAAAGQHSASLYERAAYYTLEARGDVKRAATLAKQAVAISPNSAKCRLTLAQAYVAAKLRESALAELERARALEPESPVIKDWLARVKRGS